MNFGGFGKFPATKATNFTKLAPAYSKFTKAPGFAKAGKGATPAFGKFGKAPGVGAFGKVPGFSKFGKVPGYPVTKSTGFNTVVPSTTVVTGPSPGLI